MSSGTWIEFEVHLDHFETAELRSGCARGPTIYLRGGTRDGPRPGRREKWSWALAESYIDDASRDWSVFWRERAWSVAAAALGP